MFKQKLIIGCMQSTGLRSSVFAVLVIASLLLTGCPPVPVIREYEEPERISLIDLNGLPIGVTTRKDIQKAFGKPDLRRYNDKLWIYGWAVKSSPLSLQAYTARVLFIEYDSSGILQDIDLIDGQEACRDDGICIRDWEITEKEWGTYAIHWLMIWRLKESRTIVTAPDIENERARHYVPDDGVCGLYVFGDISRFAIEDHKDIKADEDTFAFFEMENGKKVISLYLGLLISKDNFPVSDLAKREFECGSGKNVYIEIRKKYLWKSLGLFPSNIEWVVTFLPPDVGRDRITNMQLLLLR